MVNPLVPIGFIAILVWLLADDEAEKPKHPKTRRRRVSYRNKTYVIFDGDNDIWAYRYMGGWKANDNIDFNFFDAHDLRNITNRASEESVKKTLRERMANAKQVVVLVGDSTKNLYRFVRWEIELALKKGIPIVAVNLNDLRKMDPGKCPAILKGEYVVHVPFKMRAIKYALDHFPGEHAKAGPNDKGDRFYNDETYKQLGI